MRKIKAKHSNNDRIICVTDWGCHKFYYQPAGTKERICLFTSTGFSRAIFAFFRKNGRNLEGVGFSMTLKEIYERNNYRNPKISKIFDRIPKYVEAVLECRPRQYKKALFKIYERSHEYEYVV